jgi:hypothetical protein
MLLPPFIIAAPHPGHSLSSSSSFETVRLTPNAAKASNMTFKEGEKLYFLAKQGRREDEDDG